jgi:hypothetical protein
MALLGSLLSRRAARAHDTRLEPVAFGSGGGHIDRPPPSVHVQPFTTTGSGVGTLEQPGCRQTPRTTFLFTRCSPRSGGPAESGAERKGRGRLRLVPDARVGLLSVHQAAELARKTRRQRPDRVRQCGPSPRTSSPRATPTTPPAAQRWRHSSSATRCPPSAEWPSPR